ncbi:MAG: 50S ribosomal protein L22 [Bacteroidia bacterium]|nr:50S ribosomal protein L22 [Bacteroidia bacterium]MCF8427815.1 50S ribosomal protein L22 [Bacteroidia bacterium]MCF8446053.1 50S ribosomal protein L22 [Bacteroidia bacterium]
MEAVAKLNNCPTSPRKMRLLADLIRGKRVNDAFNILVFNAKKENSLRLEKLLRSAIANWEQKNEGSRVEDSELYVKTIFVDGGAMVKRIRPAPQGRAHRIRKRSNHVTLVVDSKAAAQVVNKETKENA